MDVARALAGHLVLLALVGCQAQPGAARDQQARGDVLAAETAATHAEAEDGELGEPLDEASARRLLAGRFRAAGLRIVEDVPLEIGGVTLVVDGFDPVRRIGYEYVAPEERDLDLDDGERTRLSTLEGVRILVTEEAAAGALGRATDAFLAELPR